jgi:hypothetical protein
MGTDFGNSPAVTFVARRSSTCVCHRICWARRPRWTNNNKNNSVLLVLITVLVEEVEEGAGVGVVLVELRVVLVAAEAEVAVEDVMEVAATEAEDETGAEEGVEGRAPPPSDS